VRVADHLPGTVVADFPEARFWPVSILPANCAMGLLAVDRLHHHDDLLANAAVSAIDDQHDRF
jgi:hypothetical protein